MFHPISIWVADSCQALLDGQKLMRVRMMRWNGTRNHLKFPSPGKISSAVTCEELVSLLIMESRQWIHLSRELR